VEASGDCGGGARPAGGAAVRARLWCGRKKKGGRLGRAGVLGRPNKISFFEYTKALEICIRRFRRNFDMRIFPKFS
jgi:hypothetical protein